MDLRVAQRARLILRRLVMGRPSGLTRCSVHVGCVTAEAQEVNVIYLQHPGIGRPMRRVTRQTPFVRLNWRMFEDERSHGIGVALGAHRELSRCRSHLVPSLCSVRIVAIAALD